MVTEFASEKQFELLKKFKRQGTLSRKQLTRPLKLTNIQAVELGFDVPKGEDFTLSPLEPEEGALFGRVPVVEPSVVEEPLGVERLLERVFPERFVPEEIP